MGVLGVTSVAEESFLRCDWLIVDFDNSCQFNRSNIAVICLIDWLWQFMSISSFKMPNLLIKKNIFFFSLWFQFYSTDFDYFYFYLTRKASSNRKMKKKVTLYIRIKSYDMNCQSQRISQSQRRKDSSATDETLKCV